MLLLCLSDHLQLRNGRDGWPGIEGLVIELECKGSAMAEGSVSHSGLQYQYHLGSVMKIRRQVLALAQVHDCAAIVDGLEGGGQSARESHSSSAHASRQGPERIPES